MDVKWLEDFLSLYRLGNFSAAAKARNVTQPAFSRRIRALEIWLGVPLFDRSSNPIALTPYGEKFLPSAEDILARIHDVKFDFAQLAVQSDETVRIVSLHTFAVNVLPALLDALGEALAGINVVVNPGLQGVDNHFNTLLENSADLLMVYDIDGARPNAVEREGLQAHLLAHETLIPVISRGLQRLLLHRPGGGAAMSSGTQGVGEVLRDQHERRAQAYGAARSGPGLAAALDDPPGVSSGGDLQRLS